MSKPKKKSVENVLSLPQVVAFGGREFNATRPKMGEAYLVNRFPLLEAQMQQGDLEQGQAAQEKYLSIWARLLTARAADGEPVTPEWVAEQDPQDLARVVAPEEPEGK